METKDPKSAESAGGTSAKAESRDPKSGATSSETLSDVEESEKASEADESGAGIAEKSSAPSPDGAFDERRGGQKGVDDAGPM
ncbi:MAG TPA: hypothetical protein VEV81_10085 [Pyrinomonadaceae bacterium]|nr:hypothetical protein [Pyrinomonadaceae bacterium]